MLCTVHSYHLKRRGVKNKDAAHLEGELSDLNVQLASSQGMVALMENQLATVEESSRRARVK
jgi:hypothetical protein